MNLIINNKTNSTAVATSPLQSQWSQTLVNIEPDAQRSNSFISNSTLGLNLIAFDNSSYTQKLSPISSTQKTIKENAAVDANIRAKIVTFDNVLIIYYFKDCEDRKSYWIENRCHFQRHCNQIQDIISFIFQDAHRNKIQKLIHKWAEDYIILVSSKSSSSLDLV